MPKYENGVIYKLKHNLDYDDENIYIGSTTNFKNRKYAHKEGCNNENNRCHNFPVYQYIRDNGGWDQFIMIPIEPYSCNDKKELEIKERFYIDLLRPTLNKKIPTRTNKEYYQDNRDKLIEYQKEYKQNNSDKIAEYQKEYYQDNSDKITEYRKEYYQDNRDKIIEKKKIYYEDNRDKILEKFKQYRQDNRGKNAEYMKEYRQNNRDKIAEYKKEYYQDNRDKIAEKLKEKVICDHCGCEVNKNNLKRHQQSNKCINFKKD